MSDSDSHTQACPKCGRELPATLAFFSADRSKLHGLTASCRECRRRDYRNWYAANKERRSHYQRSYVAAHREEKRAKRRAYVEANRTRISERMHQWHLENSERRSAYSAAYNFANRERRRAQSRAWQMAHRAEHAASARNRYARKKHNGGIHSAADIKEQYARQKGRCFYCGESVGDKYHVDHVVPIISGGSNGPENLVIACPTCNQSKGSKHPMDFCGRLL